MKKRKRRMPLKQRRFFKELLRSKNAKEAAIKAGYSPKAAKVTACRILTDVNPTFIQILEKHGLTEDKIAQTLVEGLEASTLFFFGGKLMGRLNDSAIEKLSKLGITLSGDDFLEIPDRYARHKFLETLIKLRMPNYANPKVPVEMSGDITIKFEEEK